MPRVIQAEQRVQSNALQGVMQKAPSNQGAIALGRGVTEFGSDLADKQNYERTQVNKARVKDIQAQYQTELQKSLYGVDGFKSKQGLDASSPEAQQAYFDSVNEIGESFMSQLDSQEQKDMFAPIMQTLGGGASNRAISHAGEQREAYKKEASEALVTSSAVGIQMNPNDASAVELNRGIAHREIIETMTGMGDPTEKGSPVNNALLEFDSKAFLAAAQNLVDNDQPEAAKDLINNQKGVNGGDILSPDDRESFDDLFEKSTFKLKAKNIMVEIWDEEGSRGDMEDQVEEMAGDDVLLYEEAIRQLDNRWERKEKAKVETRRAYVEDKADLIEKGEWQVSDMTAQEIDTLDSKDITYLKAYEKANNTLKQEESDQDALTRFWSLDVKDMAKVNLKYYADRLTPTHYEQVLKIVHSARQGKGVSSESVSTQNDNQRLKTVFDGLKLGKTNSDIETKKNIRTRYEVIADSFKKRHGYEPEGQEAQKILNEIVKEIYPVKHNDPIGEFFRKKTKQFEVELNPNITSSMRSQIMEAVEEDGDIPTVQNVNKKYQDYLDSKGDTPAQSAVRQAKDTVTKLENQEGGDLPSEEMDVAVAALEEAEQVKKFHSMTMEQLTELAAMKATSRKERAAIRKYMRGIGDNEMFMREAIVDDDITEFDDYA